MLSPPPRVRPPTPTPETWSCFSKLTSQSFEVLLTRPPIMVSWYCSNLVYTSYQVCPGWNDTLFRSSEGVVLFILSKLMVIPPSMFEPPGTAECPPLFAANGHCVSRDKSIEVDTSRAFSGLNTHWGEISACWADQKSLRNAVYADSDCVST
jgi:hypothetical protein